MGLSFIPRLSIWYWLVRPILSWLAFCSFNFPIFLLSSTARPLSAHATSTTGLASLHYPYLRYSIVTQAVSCRGLSVGPCPLLSCSPRLPFKDRISPLLLLASRHCAIRMCVWCPTRLVLYWRVHGALPLVLSWLVLTTFPCCLNRAIFLHYFVRSFPYRVASPLIFG